DRMRLNTSRMAAGRQQLQTTSSEVEESLGGLVRRERQGLGWSLSQLADRTGLSKAYLSAIERGKSRRPGAETVRRLEGALGQLTHRSPEALDAPSGLIELATERGLSQTELRSLSAIRIRGKQPRTKERWSFIYEALLSSESIDERKPPYQKRSDR